MTPQQELARRERLVAAARAMLSMQVGLATGAFRLERVLGSLGEPYQSQHSVFRRFTGAIPADIPVGSARLHWVPALLLATDTKLAKIEDKFRASLLEECIAIIQAYGPNNKFKPKPLRGSA